MPALRTIDINSLEALNKYTGLVVCHFKRELTPSAELDDHPRKYLYEIIAIGNYTDSSTEKAVIYKSLYDNTVYVRPQSEFFSEVDHKKYPTVKQKWRFEYLPKLTVSEVLSWKE